MTDVSKQKAYEEVLTTIEALIEGQSDLISVMSTVSCELFHAFDHFNWVGFYRRVDATTLKVGPYQGRHGCLTIDIRRGVCGACAREAAIQIENDVLQARSHIACSAATKAEIVLPVLDQDGNVAAVLDIDSDRSSVFDDIDVTALQQVTRWVEAVNDSITSTQEPIYPGERPNGVKM
ncbi:MAG: GAF domain-containing protein [Verrucomicrobia bacterium]|jgi:L-methionine (R)-S-oxide reductase|nr:GAF domain-containing protein [Verrucomicrobiota bacterium]MBT7064901.1 GAF domain-containing protein [Verrucomicrobiota bacterium]MBT7699972.1 GAF domain-containing protein [Verrucomicrobiota bacterium]